MVSNGLVCVVLTAEEFACSLQAVKEINRYMALKPKETVFIRVSCFLKDEKFWEMLQLCRNDK